MSKWARRFQSRHGSHLFVADGSQIYDVEATLDHELLKALDEGEEALKDVMTRYGLAEEPRIDDRPLQDLPVRALSLAVAQKCNLGCAYCYAQGGQFGGAAKNMSWEVARDAVLLLLEGASAGDQVNIAFMGGEPLVNRGLIRRVTEFAAEEGKARSVRIGLSITTNGTLVQPGDAEFFENYGFAVTVSLDGIGDIHDKLRPFRGGGGSYDRITRRIEPMLRLQRRMQVSARVTVTPFNLGLLKTLDGLIELGFHSVGFAPMLKGASPELQLGSMELETMLAELVACGRKFENETIAGRRYPFSNIGEALRQIHRGVHRPYPCGAGAGYFGVSSDGDLFACHRFVEDPLGRLGSVGNGLDRSKRNIWLAERHVHRQAPCSDCWARYLCGGGCHHEVIHRGRHACDFIRGWLDYCLSAYVNVMEECPAFFGGQRVEQ